MEHSFIAGSHTHHGPVLELSDVEGKGKGKFDAVLRYYKELEEVIIAVIVFLRRNEARLQREADQAMPAPLEAPR